MLKNLLLVLFAALYFAGCSKEAPIDRMPPPPATIPPMMIDKDTTMKKYLALGDSYTIGQNVAGADRFPAQTVALLRQSGISISDLEYVATTGWTTTNLMNAINTAALKPPYSIVSLLIGVNDQYQLRDTTNYREKFTALLSKAVVLAGNRPNRVFVLSIPDYSVTPFVAAEQKATVSLQIDQFNAINKQVTLQKNISYTDITPSSREGATNPSLITNDGLHPSGSEYRKWAALLAPKMKAVLQ